MLKRSVVNVPSIKRPPSNKCPPFWPKFEISPQVLFSRKYGIHDGSLSQAWLSDKYIKTADRLSTIYLHFRPDTIASLL